MRSAAGSSAAASHRPAATTARARATARCPRTPRCPLPPQINENALFTDLDLLARRRGESYDWVGRLSAGYDKTFGQETTGVVDPTRVSLASLEVLDRPLGLLARLGRQAYNQDGVLGTFDGLFVSWQFRPSWALNVATGYPVEQLQLAPQTDERFETLALAYTPPGAHWDASVFVAHQRFQELTDREAVGANLRYLASKVSLVVGVRLRHLLPLAQHREPAGYPAAAGALERERRRRAAQLTGTDYAQCPDRAAVHGPQCSCSRWHTDEEIYQWAQDRTPVTNNFSLTASRPLGSRFVFTGIVNASSTGATPASGGVAAVPASGTLMTYQAQLYASNVWKTGDFNVLTFTHSNTEIGKVDSISTNLRFPLDAAWRLGPRFAVDRLSGESDGSTSTTYIPSLLIEYQRGRGLFQLDMGGELGKRQALLQLQNGAFVQTQNTTRYYVSLSYRIDFLR